MAQSASDILDQAEVCFRESRLDDAVGLLTSASEQEPDNLLLKVRLAEYLRRSGRLEASIELYRSCALLYADQGALPFAVAIYKLLVPLQQGPLLADDGKPFLRELVQRFQRHKERMEADGASAEAVPEIPLFKDLARDELEDLIQGIVPLKVNAGSAVFREGDEGASLFIIIRGFVRVKHSSAPAQSVALARLEPGEFFGEWSLLTGASRRHASVEAETDVELLELSRETINDVVARYPRVKQIMDAFYRRRKVDTLLARVFPSLSGPDRRRMAECLQEEVRHPAGSVIYREGDRSEYMSIIDSGTVEVYTNNLDGIKVSLAVLQPGQYFGEGGALSGQPRVATVKALSDVVLYNISREDLVSSLVHRPEILKSLQGVRAERLEATLEKLEESDFALSAAPDGSGSGGEEEPA